MEDYFEFWGESNRQTLSHISEELYQDPWTTTNVYWLSWQVNTGSWMVEEQGQIIDAEANQSIQAFSFCDKVHIERDVDYDRLRISTPRDVGYH